CGSRPAPDGSRPRPTGKTDGRNARKPGTGAGAASAGRKRLATEDSQRGSAARSFPFQPGEALRTLRIGTRGSLLAKWQAESIRKRLFAATGVEPEIVIIKTAGDKMLDGPVAQIGSKGIFIKELEEALLEETIDLAVHSVKDIPTDIPSRLMFPAVCKRDDVRDCMVGSTVANLRQGARVGTSSLRRQAQLGHVSPDLELCGLGGNVGTRPRKGGKRGVRSGRCFEGWVGPPGVQPAYFRSALSRNLHARGGAGCDRRGMPIERQRSRGIARAAR